MLHWKWKYVGMAAFVFCVELCIAFFIKDTIIRPFIGDVLVVVLLYLGCRAIFKISAEKIAIGVVVFAFGVEVLQFFNVVEVMGWQDNQFARVVIGNTFDWWDLLAYGLGGLFAYKVDKMYCSRG